MTDPFDDARQQIAGDRLLRAAESELLSLDPQDDDDLRRLAELLHARAHAKDALLVATARDEHDGDHRELFGMADRELRAAPARDRRALG